VSDEQNRITGYVGPNRVNVAFDKVFMKIPGNIYPVFRGITIFKF